MSSETATAALSQLELNECPMAKLADEDLAKIFKNLPPYERLIVSEVCVQWRDVSQAPWRDLTRLVLSQVPTQTIPAVIKKCPNLTSVSALRQNLGDLGRFASRISSISTLKCVDCTFTTDLTLTRLSDVHASFRSASWKELIWHNSRTVLFDSGLHMHPREHPYALPYGISPTLRRLQLSAVDLQLADICDVNRNALAQLPLLESCILTDAESSAEDWFSRVFTGAIYASRAMLTNLGELYLESPRAAFTAVVSALPNLKTLYVNNIDFGWTNFERLVMQHASLCVLMLTASSDSDFAGQILIPARKLFPNGFNAPPMPQLHLFLGKIAAERLRFHPSPTDALKIYPIDAPLPEFLEKQEIKPIFEDSWIASRIKEGVKDGAELADYSFDDKTDSINYVQQ